MSYREYSAEKTSFSKSGVLTDKQRYRLNVKLNNSSEMIVVKFNRNELIDLIVRSATALKM